MSLDAPVAQIGSPFTDDPELGPALTRLRSVLPDARLVGGSVRDLLAGRPVADIDLATPRTPDAVVAALGAAGIRAVPTGLDHGTVTAVMQRRSFEITTLRRDEDTDGRHARVAFTDNWREDAARRDFTINAMSMTYDGAVFDYFGGIDDLRAGRVRFVGTPALRIAEDYLRILRFFRFLARYGTGEPDGAAVEAIGEAVGGLARLSAERVWSELARILAVPQPGPALRWMARLGVLAAILPESGDPAALGRMIAAGAPPEPLLRLAALLASGAGAAAPSQVAARLKLSAADTDRLAALLTPTADDVAAIDPAADDAALRRALSETPRDVLLGRAWLAADGDEAWVGLRERLAAMPVPRFPLEGRDVLALGVAPGPPVGRVLRAVRDWWKAGGCLADAATCRAELARRLAG